MYVNLDQDYREEMAYWLRIKMDADLRGDKATSDFALAEYRKNREKLRESWGDLHAGRTA
ncbi:hypothetical protein D3C77_735310 [compost metagenome]